MIDYNPLNPHYGHDCFFSADGGLEESRHVFMAGNDLPRRLAACFGPGAGPWPVIGELGFGTGLNLYALVSTVLEAAAALAARPASLAADPADRPGGAGFALPPGRPQPGPVPRLDFLTVEKHPLDLPVVRQALAGRGLEPVLEAWLLDCHRQLLADVRPGWNRLVLALPPPAAWPAGGPALPVLEFRLWQGDVLDFLAAWQQAAPAGPAGAWLLDGHDPALNPDMWSPQVCAGLAANSLPGLTTFASYTAAGVVKRNLRQAGFFVVRRPGFGRKRHMIQGHYAGSPVPESFQES